MTYKFEDIAYNSTEKKVPEPSDKDCYIGLEHLDSDCLEVSRWGADVAPVGEKLRMRKGDVLFGKRRAYQRKVGIAPFDGIFSAHGMVLRPKEEVVCKEYFPFFISSDQFMNRAVLISVGGLSPTINWKDLKVQEFDLPDLPTQKSLAEKLWAAYDLKEKYKKLLAATDEMVKSQFIEMFKLVDSDLNVANYVPFGTCVEDMTKGPFGSDIKKSLYVPKSKDTYKVYIQANAIDHDVTLGDYYISKEYYDSKMYKFAVNPGDYIITCDGTLGRYIQLPDGIEKGIISASLLRLTLKDVILPRYFEYLWDLYMMRELSKEVRNTALQHLPSATKIGEVKIPLPSVDAQERFSDIAEQADKSKFELRKSIEAIDQVIKSLINN